MNTEFPRLTGLFLGVLSWVAIWGIMDLIVHNWSARQKFWLYTSILTAIAVVIYNRPTVLEHF